MRAVGSECILNAKQAGYTDRLHRKCEGKGEERRLQIFWPKHVEEWNSDPLK